jgi:hypothetical protein
MIPRKQPWFMRALLDAMRRLTPAERRDWANAMRAETNYVADAECLGWALGCCWTAIKLRFNPMNTGDYRVSRWVMLVEAIGGFGPLALGWYEIMFGGSGVVRLSGSVIDKYFLSYPGGGYMLVMMIVNGVTGLLGPLGLVLGLRYVLTGRGIENRTVGWVLFAVPLIVNILGMIAGQFWGPADLHVSLTFSLLFAWLPAAIFLHLMWLARPVPPLAPITAI